MPDNNNLDAIKMRTRALACIDAMAELYLTAQDFEQYWIAANLDTVVPATTDVINDPANPDPGHVITNNKLRSIRTFLQNYVTDLDANTKAKANAVLQLNTNGRSRL
jgi:hypothetical protein